MNYLKLPILLIMFSLASDSYGQAVNSEQSAMVLIPEGVYLMGKDLTSYGPEHLVRIDSFYMDRHEVTNAEYFRFCQETDHRLPEFWGSDIFRSGPEFPDHPVVGISWSDANKYAEWAGKRLPTEAEWEYAARGSLSGMDYPNGNEWKKKRARQTPGEWINLIDPVGRYEPNGYGLYDMGGNVWEWVSDYFSVDYYQVSPTDNPTGPDKGSFKVIRSGSWHSGAMCKKVYYRKGLPGNWCDFAVGFRCVKDMNQEE